MPFADAFLACPELFPARRAGDAWGSAELAVGFVGATYAVRGLAPAQAAAAAERFAGFPGGADARPVAIDVFRAPADELLPFPADGREYRLDVDYRPEVVRVAGHGFFGLVDRRDGLAGALWVPDLDADPFREALENFLRVVAAYRAVETDRALVHSAALARDGGVVLFPGRSGAGKSTLSGLAATAGWTVLSDELNAVAAVDPPEVEQVPFAGDFGRAPRHRAPLPLLAVCRLRQAREDAVRPVGPGETAAQLLAAAPYVNRDPYRAPAAERVLARLASSVAGWELAFRRDSDLAVLDRLLPAGVAS